MSTFVITADTGNIGCVDAVISQASVEHIVAGNMSKFKVIPAIVKSKYHKLTRN